MKLAHIINPVIISPTSDLFVAQPITFQTMKSAKKLAQNFVDVELYCAQYPEDISLVPEEFIATPNLDRSILDCDNFAIKRKLPLIKDILDHLYQATDADYLIYTNVDIALMPSFYLSITNIINQGYDAFSINRRTIDDKYQQVAEIPLMYAELGEPHGGHDCFVFKRSLYPNFQLGLTCIGIQFIGLSMMVNCICNAQKFRHFKDLHLTFHIGNDRKWKGNEFDDYRIHNANNLRQALEFFLAKQELPEHPVINIAKKLVIGENAKFKASKNSFNSNSKLPTINQLEKIKEDLEKSQSRLNRFKSQLALME